MTEEQVHQLVALSPSIPTPVDFDGWKAMREEYDYTWENIWEFIVKGYAVPPEFQMTTKKKTATSHHPELWSFPGKKRLSTGEGEYCRFCQSQNYMTPMFCADNEEKGYAFTVYQCEECDAICKKDVWDHAGELWIAASGDMVATNDLGERIREKGIIIEDTHAPKDEDTP